MDTAYQKQQETLIVWSEGDNFDLALSFQEKAGCDEIWEKICSVSGKIQKAIIMSCKIAMSLSLVRGTVRYKSFLLSLKNSSSEACVMHVVA